MQGIISVHFNLENTQICSPEFLNKINTETLTYFLQFKETKEVMSIVYETWKILLTETEKKDNSISLKIHFIIAIQTGKEWLQEK